MKYIFFIILIIDFVNCKDNRKFVPVRQTKLLDLYFTLEGRCSGFFAGIHRNSLKFEFSPEGKSFLNDAKYKMEKYLKK